MPDDYAYDPAWDYGYDPSYGAGYQSLPNDTSELAPVGGLSASTAAAPTDERSSLLASLPPEYLTGVDPAALDLPTLRTLARSAGALTFEQNAAKSNTGGVYALENPAEYYKAYGSVPISFTGNSGYYDKGVSGTSIDYLTPDANASYTLYSPKSGKVIATGSGVEGLLDLAQQANALNADLGREADWQLYQAPAGGGEQKLLGSNLYNSDATALGKVVGAALPIVASFIPGFGQLGTLAKMAAMAGAGGLGAALSGNDILKGALLSGATAGLVSGTGLDRAISGALSGAGSNALTEAGANAIGQTAGQTAGNEIVVNALSKLAQAGGTALGQGALNTIGNSLITSTGAKVPTDVTSSNMGTGSVPTDVTPSSMGTGSVPTSIGGAPLPLDGITVLGGQFANPAAIAAAQGATTGALSTVVNGVDTATGEIVAEAPKPTQAADTTTGTAGTTVNTILDGIDTTTGEIVAEAPKPTQAADTTTGALSTVGNVVNGVDTATGEIVAEAPKTHQAADTTTGALSTVGNVVNGVDTATGEIVAEAPKTNQAADTTTGALSTVGNVVNGVDTATGEIVAEAPKTNQAADTTTPGLYTPSIIETAALTGLSPQEVLDASNSPDTSKSTLDKVIDYLKAAGLGVGLLGNLGGGSGGGSGTMPGGMGARSPIYSATLPTPGQNGAFAVGGLDRGTGAGGIGGVTPPGGDYTRFGMGSATRATPTAIPQYGGVNPPGFNTQTWEWLGPQTGVPKDITDQLAVLPSSAAPAEPVKKAMGGYAVGGPGDGRSDEIPAMLSDGEYVIDAETVALLGNGSNKAGAQQLDKFRANIRKHKGRELARGQFSVKAKAPDAYLPKGRS